MALLSAVKRFSSLTFVSRILGFVRDMLIARNFGSGDVADAFFVAFKIPNLFRRLFAEGAFSQAFIPVLSEVQKNSKQEENGYVNSVFTTLTASLFLFCSLGMLFAPFVVGIFAPGFIGQEAKFDLAVKLLVLTFPYLFFISLSALLAALLNTWGQFSAAAFAPVYLNISLIVAALYASTWFDEPVIALGWGVSVAGIIQFFWLWFFVQRGGLRLRFGHWKNPEVLKTMRLMVPALFGVSVAQINLLIDTLLASFLVSGSVSWLYYSDRLMELPLGMIGVALSTVALPALAKLTAINDREKFQGTLEWALRIALFASVPAAFGLIILSYPILITLFTYGAFKVSDAQMASLSLMAYAAGLPAFVLIKVMASVFYARQEMKTPVKIAAFSMLVNIVLNLILMQYIEHVGLALATSISGWINAGLLMFVFKRKNDWRISSELSKDIFRIALSSVLMSAFLYYISSVFTQWEMHSWLFRAGQLSVVVLLGGGVYFIVVAMLGLRYKRFNM